MFLRCTHRGLCRSWAVKSVLTTSSPHAVMGPLRSLDCVKTRLSQSTTALPPPAFAEAGPARSPQSLWTPRGAEGCLPGAPWLPTRAPGPSEATALQEDSETQDTPQNSGLFPCRSQTSQGPRWAPMALRWGLGSRAEVPMFNLGHTISWPQRDAEGARH